MLWMGENTMNFGAKIRLQHPMSLWVAPTRERSALATLQAVVEAVRFE